MMVHLVAHRLNFYFLCSLFMAIGSMVGINDEVMGGGGGASRQEMNAPQNGGNGLNILKHQEKVDVADKGEKFAGCNLEENEPIPPFEESRVNPCVSGVPMVEIATKHWNCPPVGTSPNQTCHWAYEDKLGCNNGGASKMCDTVPVAGGTECRCNPAP